MNNCGDSQVILRWAEEQKWLRFSNPVEVFQADRPEQVVSILAGIEKEVETKKLYAAGFVSYEASPAFDPALRCRKGGDFPLLWFGLFKKAEQFAVPAVKAREAWVPECKSTVTKEEYKRAVQAVKKYIVQGATYQVNYSYRLLAPFTGDPCEYFFQVAGERNIPYAAFVETDRSAICSFSPELFFSLRGLEIYSKPMKGTMPRGFINDDDLRNAQLLYLSEKNRAENIMIVDMVRNDLSRVASPGTVAVPSMFDVEKFDTVWQMTSTVRAETSASLPDLFKALFPPASITGAPKVITARIITELETSPRRIYTGSIGFLAPGRRAQFNVAIRTLLIDKRNSMAEYGVGGGIVWDSVDSDEYDECAVKAKVVCAPAPAFDLLETILWRPGDHFFLLDLHLARLKASAAYFSFQYDGEQVLAKLSAMAAGLPQTPHRVRLLLDRGGKIKLDIKPFLPDPQEKLPRVCLAKEPVASDNIFLYHKTTNRLVYEKARASRPGYDEVVLWNEKGLLTEFCAANLILDLEGRLVTPTVGCGLLPGTYRAWLLQKGMVSEQSLEVGLLRRCRRAYLCNSVREMKEVQVDFE